MSPALVSLLSCGVIFVAPKPDDAQHQDRNRYDHHYFDHHYSDRHDYNSHHFHYYRRDHAYSQRQYERAYERLVAEGKRCRIEVRVPSADAEVLFDGNKTTSVGLTRLFDVRELEPGQTYLYQITASWSQAGKTVTDQRTVTVIAGGTIVVDFTRAAGGSIEQKPSEPDTR